MEGSKLKEYILQLMLSMINLHPNLSITWDPKRGCNECCILHLYVLIIKEMGFHDQMVSLLTSTITVRINLLALLLKGK